MLGSDPRPLSSQPLGGNPLDANKNERHATVIRFALLVSAIAVSLGLAGCTAPAKCFEQGYYRSYSNRSAGVYVEVNSKELILYNDTQYPIYHVEFPTEFLDNIEWGPCDDRDECPELKIEPSQARHDSDFHLYWDEIEGSVTVFWWHIFDPGTELDVDYAGVQLIEIDLPPRVPCE